MTLSLYAMTVFSYSSRPSVRRPLHGGKVDPFLVHLVKGRHVPQLADGPRHEVRHEVDLRLGVESTDPEPDRRVRQVVADAHRVEHVRGLEARARAGRTARDGDVLDGHHERLAFDEAERDVQVAG